MKLRSSRLALYFAVATVLDGCGGAGLDATPGTATLQVFSPTAMDLVSRAATGATQGTGPTSGVLFIAKSESIGEQSTSPEPISTPVVNEAPTAQAPSSESISGVLFATPPIIVNAQRPTEAASLLVTAAASAPLVTAPDSAVKTLVVPTAPPLSPTVSLPAVTLFDAARLVDSVGVNLHSYYLETIYASNFPLLNARLVELGVKHVRDEMKDTRWQGYYDHFVEMASEGIKAIFIVSPHLPDEVVNTFPSRVGSAFEGYEGPNEMNLGSDPNWPTTLRDTMLRLKTTRDAAGLNRYPIIGPSLTSITAFNQLGDISELIDYGNMHNYPSGLNPGTAGWDSAGQGSIEWNLANAKIISGQKPVYTTETGYFTDGTSGSTPADIVARYAPRLLLEQFRKGVIRTYIYELIDIGNPPGTFGLLDLYGNPKASFSAIKHLLQILAPVSNSISESVSLRASLSGGESTVRNMTFRVAPNRFLMAIWIEAKAYDWSVQKRLIVPQQLVRLMLEPNAQLTKEYRWDDGGEVTESEISNGNGTVALTISDHLTIFEINSSRVGD